METQLHFSYYGEFSPPPNAQITLIVNRGAASFILNGYRITSISRKGRRVSVKARDMMRTLEKPIDISPYTDEPIPSSQAVEAIARDCGFNGAANVPVTGLVMGDLKGRTARQLLRDLSEAFCGVWVCAGNVLTFCPWGSITSSVICPDTSPLYMHSDKGPITRLTADNTETHAQYLHGSGDYTATVRIRGRMITSENSGAVMQRLAQKHIRSFSCFHVPVYSAPMGVVSVVRNGIDLPCLEYTLHIGSQVYLDGKYPDICEDEFDYITKEGYALRERLTTGTAYGAAVVTDKGIGIMSAEETEDIRNRQAYFFEAAKGAVTRFGGAVMDTAMPLSVTDLGGNVKRIAYDGTSYLLSYTKSGGQISNISLSEEGDDPG